MFAERVQSENDGLMIAIDPLRSTRWGGHASAAKVVVWKQRFR